MFSPRALVGEILTRTAFAPENISWLLKWIQYARVTGSLNPESVYARPECWGSQSVNLFIFDLLIPWEGDDGCDHERTHYDDVIMAPMASQITSLTVVYSIVYSDADQRKHQSSASLAFVWGIQRGPVNSPHRWPVTRKMFPFDDVIMNPHVMRNVSALLRDKTVDVQK